jgi:signal transduction histidine kinase
MPNPSKQHFLPIKSIFKKPRKLWVDYSLRLGLVLCLATIIPILLLYLLIKMELIEASYGIDTNQLGQSAPNLPLDWYVPDSGSLPDASPTNESRVIPEQLWAPPDTIGERNPVTFDPVSGRWRIRYNLSDVVFVVPIFRFKLDMPAWIALGSLLLISLLVGVIFSIWMSRSVTRPISQLAQAAQAIGKRDLSYRVETEGSQELLDLASSINRMAQELEHAETTRRNLTADVAHELRTPLAVLDGNLRAILDGVHELSEVEIALLYEQTHHLNRLVDDLREISLAENAQLSLNILELDLGRLIKETAAHFDLLAQEQGIQLSTQLDEPLIHPSLDENRVRQVLHNLLSNAFCYTPPGGKVSISGKQLSDDGYLEINISDSGAGISPEELPYIFSRFYRAENPANRGCGGTGLGLAIVKAIVEAQGGQVSAYSAGRDLGSTFSIKFPF